MFPEFKGIWIVTSRLILLSNCSFLYNRVCWVDLMLSICDVIVKKHTMENENNINSISVITFSEDLLGFQFHQILHPCGT